ncbi:acetyl-CoA carboxylase biotin carboxyl carrier protein [Salinicoccus carnicancri]|uniref:acetyl-CoA carboxylase biotin carboxyl carrier protein n=1 Tax=Salinicoccus carnicancri TaxID=558170 RepID=UPI000319FB51|nr:biotin/lipoyl-containing protein [Salinicoccus carnicancri]
MDVEKIRELIKLAKEEDLKVLRVGDMDTEVHIETKGSGDTVVTEHGGKDKSSADGGHNGLHTVKAAQVGTFYTHKEENSTENFVEAGDKVASGDQIGMIEAMKVFNDVLADADGVVEEVLVGNGETVEYDQPLVTLRPKED